MADEEPDATHIDPVNLSLGVAMTFYFIYIVYANTVAWFPQSSSTLGDSGTRQSTVESGVATYMALIMVMVPALLLSRLGHLLAKFEAAPLKGIPVHDHDTSDHVKGSIDTHVPLVHPWRPATPRRYEIGP